MGPLASRHLSAPLSFTEADQRLHDWPGPCLGGASLPERLGTSSGRCPAIAARPGCSQHRSTRIDVERRWREPPTASSAASTPAQIGYNTCEEVAAGRLVWEVDSGSDVGSGVGAPQAAPRAGGGIAHRPVLGGLELGHAHSFDMRHVKPSMKLYAAVQT